MVSDKSLGSSGTESRVYENDCYFVMMYWTYWTLGILAKVFKNLSGKWCWGIISSLRTLLTCGALERTRPETVQGALSRSNSIDIIDMSTLWRQYTEVCY